MKTSVIFAIVAVVLTFFALPRGAQATSDDQSARDEAVGWVGLMDAGQYRQAYEAQPPRVKAASAGRDYFVRWMQTQRVPLGRVRARSFYNRRYYHDAIGWPDGNYVQIYFKTSFERKAAGWERVILTKETGRWQPAKYNVWWVIEWQRIGNQINAAMIFARADFVNVLCDHLLSVQFVGKFASQRLW